MDTSTVAGRGHLDVLKWMHEHFPRSFSSDTMDAAARNGRIDAMTWLHENRREGCSRSAAYFAGQMGHLGVLKWIHTYYPNKFGPAAINVATVKGHLEVVRWLLENHPEGYTQHAPHSAAFWGHLDIFLYLLEHLTEGFPANDTQDIEVMCRFASVVPGNGRVTSDQLKMLQNIFERRPAFLQRWLRFLVAISCSGTGNVAILDWVNQFGLELNSSEPIRNVVGCGDLKMLQWFFENGFEITDPDLLEVAAQSRCLEVVRWLSEHGHDVNSLKLIQFGDNIPIMRWLVERGLPLDLSTASALVLESRHIEIAWWAAEMDRKHLVLEALQKNDREVVWWLLAHTKFLDKSARRSIREAIHHCPKDTYQWLEETMRQVEACRWCFFTSIKKRNEESAETDLFSTKRRRCDEVLE